MTLKGVKAFKQVVQIPHAVMAGDYVIREGPAGFGESKVPHGKTPGVFITPGDNSEDSINIRAHEMGHLGLEATKFLTYEKLGIEAQIAGISDNTLDIATDMLVNGRYRSAIGPLPIRDDMETLEVMGPEDLMAHTMRAASIVNKSPSVDRVLKFAQDKLGESTVDYIGELASRIRWLGQSSDRLDYGEFMGLANQLEYLVRKAREIGEEGKDAERAAEEAQKEAEAKDGESKETEEPSETEYDAEDLDSNWGKMSVQELRLQRDVMRMLGYRKWKLGYVGALRQPTRWFSDFKMYGIKRKRVPVNVLIDTSGSMHLNDEELLDILKNSPYAQVAIYSGEGDEGTLSIIARKGMVATIESIRRAIHEAGGGNIVDGPALAWLGKQDGVKYWICDGGVTGCGDGGSHRLQAEADMLVHASGILRFGYVGDYVKGEAATSMSAASGKR